MRVTLAFGLILLVAGCEQILDLKPAEIDPELGGAAGDSGANNEAPFDAAGGFGFGGTGTEPATPAGGEAGADPDGGSMGSLGGSGAEAGSAADAGDAGASLCELYCDTVMNECSGAFSVYARRENCLGVCKALPVGTPADTSGNSVYCRLQAARVAAAELPYYCPAAGPGGNGVCGANCESFCALADQLCSGSNRQFADMAACLTACQALPDLGGFTTSSTAGQYSGPHVQCRLFHVSNAALDPVAHCPHAGGAKPCQ